mmetsp:Transcript_22541/g.38332  ORF Transcript_22541/g.38332 Transcript_22541/m.38332 type:complete len:94 (-) Transcript_22541:180-461(-)
MFRSITTFASRSSLIGKRSFGILSLGTNAGREIGRIDTFALRDWMCLELGSMTTTLWEDFGFWNMSSTLKKRRAKMNKHKLRKRRKKLRLKGK